MLLITQNWLFYFPSCALLVDWLTKAGPVSPILVIHMKIDFLARLLGNSFFRSFFFFFFFFYLFIMYFLNNFLSFHRCIARIVTRNLQLVLQLT